MKCNNCGHIESGLDWKTECCPKCAAVDWTQKGRRIYVASSWRNERQPSVVSALRAAGHEVYDFRDPASGGPPCNIEGGFSWAEIDPAWQSWTTEEYVRALEHERGREGFAADFNAMRWADALILVLPCGRSAHLEAGWATGAGIPVAVLLSGGEEPELMYKLVEPSGALCVTVDEVLSWLGELPEGPAVACGTFEPALLKRPASEIATELGQSLRAARVFLNRSLRDVALGAGLSLVRLSEIERGVGEPAARDEVERVVRALLPA